MIITITTTTTTNDDNNNNSNNYDNSNNNTSTSVERIQPSLPPNSSIVLYHIISYNVIVIQL